jgi:hypothetical protein
MKVFMRKQTSSVDGFIPRRASGSVSGEEAPISATGNPKHPKLG